MIDWCIEQGLPTLPLLNKADKLKAGARRQALREVLSEPAGANGELFSAITGLGTESVLATIRAALSQRD